MPVMVTQKPNVAPVTMPPFNPSGASGVLGTALNMTEVKRAWIKACIYGRNRQGKSTLAAQCKKPALLIATEPAENGGIASVVNVPGITPIVISVKPQIDPRTGNLEMIYGKNKVLTLVNELNLIFQQQGRLPFASIIVDTVTALEDIILTEILNLPDVPTMLKWGMVGEDQYRERSEVTREVCRKIKDLPADVIFCAQEKDHRPNKDRSAGPKMIRPMQEGSFMGVALGGATAGWLHDTCDFVLQLYQDQETRAETSQIKIGNEVREETVMVPTGRIVRRLRTMLHPNYAGGCRCPNPHAVPEYIQANSPTEMWEEFVKITQGVKSDKGYYSNK